MAPPRRIGRPGARPASSPGFIEPCRPALREKAPSGGRWIHEIKFDGYTLSSARRKSAPGASSLTI